MADVHLRPMHAKEYSAWYERTVADYAKDHVGAGNWSEAEAPELSRKEFEALLPEGTRSPGQHLYTITDAESEDAVGMVWFAERGAPEPPQAFIYNIEIDVTQRGKGYGKATMLALESEVRALGLHRIGLHVFGHNETAIRLYERSGYRTTNILMAKDLAE